MSKHKQIHAKALRSNNNIGRLAIALFFYILITHAIIQDDFLLGFSFLSAGGLAIYTGAIYKSEKVMILVLLGVAVGTVIPSIVGNAFDAYGDLPPIN